MWFSVEILCLFTFFIYTQAQNRCTTPNGDSGRCISVYSCQILLNVVRSKDPEQIRFLRESQCGYSSNPLVCCGRYDNFQKQTTNTWGEDRGSDEDVDKINYGNGDDDYRVNNNNNNNRNRDQYNTNQKNNNGRNRDLLPNRTVCGRQSPDKILGGQSTSPDEFPWMALLQYRKKNGDSPFSCGGSLISSRYVLTAAHCVTGKILSAVGKLYSVRLGEWDTETDRDCQTVYNFQSCNDPPVDVEVERAFAHSGYSDTNVNRYNDIALVRLKENVEFSNFIKPICLPSSSDRSRLGDELYVAGWGRTENSGHSAKKLKLKVPIASTDKCLAKFRSAGVSLSDKQICAGGQAGKDSCSGDSGGPLMRTFSTDGAQWYVEGVVSFGASCGREGWPGIYTRVSEYVDWIKESVKE
ncbi:phenoloxidase-activating factor 1-like [Coccinella septempunctata]|uniref:phenoloxidase-activating factor 1-like n=1 Tax=Coccinella septempunctata TaxID=41139 RepID=UPI001D065792|nr:phenoloxidase-activating factor 1-like [Coccinella septempunctata]